METEFTPWLSLGGGALIGASFGFAYLKKQRLGSLTSAIHDFVKNNPRYFRRFRK